MRDSAVVQLPGTTTELHWTDRYSVEILVSEKDRNSQINWKAHKDTDMYRRRWNEDRDRVR